MPTSSTQVLKHEPLDSYMERLRHTDCGMSYSRSRELIEDPQTPEVQNLCPSLVPVV